MADDDAADARRPAGARAGSGLSGLFRRRGPLPESRLMGRNEQLAAYGVSLLAIVAAFAIWVPEIGHHAKGANPAAAIAIGVAIGLLIGFFTRTRNRFATGLVAALGGFGPWAKYPLLGFPFLLLAGWLLMRNSRAIRDERGVRRPERPQRKRQGGAAPARNDRTARVGRGRRRKDAEADGGRRPPPNKRYTPPKAGRGG